MRILKLVKSLYGRTKISQSGNREDLLYMRDLHAAVVEQQSAPEILWALYFMAAFLVTALIWAKFARVEEITEGAGKVIAISGEQIIQSLEGGILSELNVKEGDKVERGQPLLRLDPVRTHTAFQESYSKSVALMASAARLKAEVFSKPLQFPSEVQSHPDIVKNETETYYSRRRALEQSVAGLERSLQMSDREISITEPLVAKGLVSDLELIKMQRQSNDFRMQIADRKNKFSTEANLELVKVESDLSQSKQNAAGREDTMKRTVINAPVNGIVKNIRVQTIGGVIQPAVDIMEIVPLGEELIVEAKIRPKDVAFLRPGLPAMVKVSAYDFGIYGGLAGQVELVSADTLREEKQSAKGGADETYYKVVIRTAAAKLKRGDKEFSIMPGMITTVEIRTGEKTVLDYLLKPVFKAKEAFRER